MLCSFYLPRNNQNSCWFRQWSMAASFCTIDFCFLHSYNTKPSSYAYPCSLIVVLYDFCIIMQTLILFLIPFICVDINAKAIGLYTIIFDKVYVRSTLSSLLVLTSYKWLTFLLHTKTFKFLTSFICLQHKSIHRLYHYYIQKQ